MGGHKENDMGPTGVPAPGLELWLSWVLLSLVSALGGWVIALALGTVSDGAIVLLVGGIEGAIVASGQTFVLRRYFRGFIPLEWIYATVIGGLLGWMLAMLGGIILTYTAFPVPGQPAPDPTYSFQVTVVIAALVGAGAGAFVGYMQHNLLEGIVLGAERWVSVNAVAFALGGAVGAPLALLGVGTLWQLTGIALGEALAAIITGLGLIWLLRQPAPNPTELDRQVGQWLQRR